MLSSSCTDYTRITRSSSRFHFHGLVRILGPGFFSSPQGGLRKPPVALRQPSDPYHLPSVVAGVSPWMGGAIFWNASNEFSSIRSLLSLDAFNSAGGQPQ